MIVDKFWVFDGMDGLTLKLLMNLGGLVWMREVCMCDACHRIDGVGTCGKCCGEEVVGV